jgi:Zn-dependent protease/CBS domain-containing protein
MGSWKIGRIAGIDIKVHFLFPLILIWVGWGAYTRDNDSWEALQAVGFVLLLFVVVVLHELGHALAAMRYGISTKDITLMPIGGLARLERIPEKPSQELVVALAGPAVNVLLAIPLAVIVWLMGEPATATRILEGQWTVWERLLYANIFLAAFNMIPAFPMDGGRVLRALLAMRMPYVNATELAAGIGQTVAVLLGVVGIFTNPFLVLIAVFIWIGAAGESNSAKVKDAIRGVRVRDVMVTRFRALEVDEPVQRAVDALMEGFQEDFPVLRGGEFVGVLTRADIVRAMAESGSASPVANYLTEVPEAVEPETFLTEVLPKLESCPVRLMPVVQGGSLVGLVTSENITEFLMLASARRRPPIAGNWRG